MRVEPRGTRQHRGPHNVRNWISSEPTTTHNTAETLTVNNTPVTVCMAAGSVSGRPQPVHSGATIKMVADSTGHHVKTAPCWLVSQ